MEIELDTKPVRYSNYKGGRRHRMLSTQWDRQEFIAWDGEGVQPTIGIPGNDHIFKPKSTVIRAHPEPAIEGVPQPYVLFGNSKEEQVIDEVGLATKTCFELLLDQKQQNPHSIFVGFAINYDINQMLKDLPDRILYRLYKKQTAKWEGYKIEWFPGKWLFLKTGERKVRLFDVFGFFQCSFIKACEKYLGKDHPDFITMMEGKAKREVFTFADLDYMITYYRSELRLLVELMNTLRTDLHNAGIDLSSWHGPGAIASTVFKQFHIRKAKAETPKEVNRAAQYAYAGGRFEQFYCGRYSGDIYEYDINSAYPSAILGLPSIQNGTWERTTSFEPGSFGVWFIERNQTSQSGSTDKPQPLYCRSEHGLITYPYQTSGWYWTPEAAITPDNVQFGFVLREDGSRPFSFVQTMYEQRKRYKAEGNSTERALKLALNSMYGKMAQRIGYKDRIPSWHQLEWAGYITSYTRAKLYEAIAQNPDAIIAVETDAVFSTTKLDLPVSDSLGEWSYDYFSEICYLQSGFYYARKDNGEIICKYRGLDKDKNSQYPSKLPYDLVLSRLASRSEFPLKSSTTRYIGLGLAIHTKSIWRSWETNERYICVGGDTKGSKRTHRSNGTHSECTACSQGMTMYDSLHPCHINGHSGKSYPHSLPWVTNENDPQLLDFLFSFE